MASVPSDDDVRRIREAIFSGRKIEAIKLYRASSGLGLKEAKDFVESLEERLRQAEPEQFTVPPRGKGCGFTALAVLAAAALWRAWS